MTQGHQLFVAELSVLTAELPDPRLAAIAAGVDAPLRTAVRGRRGVGRRTVATALGAAGLAIVEDPAADVDVHVVAETVKPEDTAALRARVRPVLVVLNKADLPGRCGVAEVADAAGAPAEAMSGLFALAAHGDRVDAPMWAALTRLAAQPADLSSTERFVSCPHPVPHQMRERLCAVLDLSGTARAVELARRGGTAEQARTMLRRLSGIDGVVARLAAVSAGVYHRRVTQAVARLEALAVGGDFADRIDEFLTRDATVAARMAAAQAVVGGQCLPGDAALHRARRWQVRGHAPLHATGRACAADIARGSVRVWAASRGGS